MKSILHSNAMTTLTNIVVGVLAMETVIYSLARL